MALSVSRISSRAAALTGAVTVLVLGMAAPAGAMSARVSVGPSGAQASGDSARPSISADGRYVAFESRARDLVPEDANADTDVFVRDRATGRTSLVSVDSGGHQLTGGSYYPSISADGRYVAFLANTAPRWTTPWDAYVHDRLTGTTTRVSDAVGGGRQNASSSQTAISGDGHHIAFVSEATNIVPSCGPPEYGSEKNVFVHDMTSGSTKCVTSTSGTSQGGSSPYSENPSLSFDGRYVAFSSGANLVVGDANGNPDVFIRDTQTDRTVLASVNSDGSQILVASHGASISADGRRVAFYSGENRYVADVVVRDMNTRVTTRLGAAHSGVYNESPALSPDGRFVAFESWATDLVRDGTPSGGQIYLRDLANGATTRVSADSAGHAGNSRSTNPSLSADGHVTAFESVATNLVPGDTNGSSDLFVRAVSPVVTVLTPRADGRYLQGARVPIAYSCSEPSDGTGVTSCQGPVASGGWLDTAHPGNRAVTLTGRDVSGNTTVRTVRYSVVARRVSVLTARTRLHGGRVIVRIACRSRIVTTCRGELRLTIRRRLAGRARYALRSGHTAAVAVRIDRHGLAGAFVLRAAPREANAVVRGRSVRVG